MTAPFVSLPTDDDPTGDRWDFEPDPDETFQFDAEDDRKWEALLFDDDDDDFEPQPDEFRFGQ